MLNHNDLYKIHFKVIDSTHKYSIREIDNISSLLHRHKMTCVYSDIQTDGIGKIGRKWQSEIGNFYATYSIVLHNKLSSTELIQRATVSVLLALDSYNVNCEVKWLNDLLLDGKKVCGVLCDLIEYKGSIYLLIGIGINLIHHPININSTSIYQTIGKLINYHQLINKCAYTIQATFAMHRSDILKIWQSRIAYMNQEIICTYNNSKVLGKLIGINNDGNLMISTDNHLLTMTDCTIENLTK